MIIESINIKSFGMITDMAMSFSDDINVIVGHNESGKSTIAAFIKYMLYGFANEPSTDDMPDERERRINWNNGTAQGTMTVRADGKRYLISRTTQRVESSDRISYKEDSSITDLETGSPAFGKVAAGEVFFGVDRELFDNTAFIGQIGDSSINENAVRQSMENILFSGNEKINNERAAGKVAVKMENLLHKSGAGGAIYELRRRKDQLTERFRSADEDNKEILAKEAILHDIRANRKEAATTRDKFADLELCYRNVLVIKSFDELHEIEEKCDAKTEEYNEYIEKNTRAGFVPTNTYLTDIAVSRRSVDDAYRTLVDAEDKYAEEKRAAGITRESEAAIELCDELGGEATIIGGAKRARANQVRSIVLASLGGLLLLAAAVFQIVARGALATTLPRIGFAIPGLLGIALSVFMTVMFFREKKALLEILGSFGTENLSDLVTKLGVVNEQRLLRDKLNHDTEEARVAYENAKDGYERAKADLLGVILKWGEEPPTSNLNDFLDGLEDKVRVFLEGETKLLSEKNELEISVRELRRHLSDKSEIEIRGQVSPLKRKVLSEIDPESIQAGIEDCERRIAELDREAENVEAELAMLKARATDPSELYSKMQENDAKIEELLLQYDACVLALKAIEGASDNLRREISPRLAEFTAELMGVMSDRKYTDLDVSDGLRVSFTSKDGERRSVDFLSGGTRDLSYVSLRMALIDMLYGEKPPVCFDESFAHQDNLRAKSMMKALKKLSDEGQQSFVFTCREREAALARDVSKSSGVYKLTAYGDDFA